MTESIVAAIVLVAFTPALLALIYGPAWIKERIAHRLPDRTR